MTEGLQSPRRAGAEDVAGIASVLSGWIEETPWMPRLYDEAQLARMIGEALPQREIWVVGRPVVAYLSLDPETAKIGALYASRTGEGIGRALMEQAKQGRSFLWLHTNLPNLAAQRFYRREGFVAVGGEIPPEPPETVPELRMEWHR